MNTDSSLLPIKTILENIMIASGLTQKALAAKLGKSEDTISNWINEKTSPSDADVIAILETARKLRVPTSYEEKDPFAGLNPLQRLHVLQLIESERTSNQILEIRWRKKKTHEEWMKEISEYLDLLALSASREDE